MTLSFLASFAAGIVVGLVIARIAHTIAARRAFRARLRRASRSGAGLYITPTGAHHHRAPQPHSPRRHQ